MKNNQIELNKLKSKLKKKEDISINKDTTINSRELIVIKNSKKMLQKDKTYINLKIKEITEDFKITYFFFDLFPHVGVC
jgi:hypothetical protein